MKKSIGFALITLLSGLFVLTATAWASHAHSNPMLLIHPNEVEITVADEAEYYADRDAGEESIQIDGQTTV